MATIFVGAKGVLCATVEMPGSLTREDALHSIGAKAHLWDVEYVAQGERPEYANGSNWQFRASSAGGTKTFKSGTELGYFVLTRTYESLVLIGADLGSGGWGFTLYDLEAERKLVEFWAAFPHLSPNNRYLVYRKFEFRGRPFYPEIKVIDFAEDWSGIDMDSVTPSEGIGEVVFPRAPPPERPELEGAYGSTVTTSRFDHVAWDLDNGTMYFPATDRTGHLNLVALQLEPVPRAVCYVPLTVGSLRSEYVDQRYVNPAGVFLRSPNAITVTTVDGYGVSSDHHISLQRACLEQE